MARQDSIIKLSGTIGDLTFFKKRDGTYQARKKSGISGDAIRNDPAFELTRQNGQEFSRAVKAASLIRRTMKASTLMVNDAKMRNRLSSTMMKVVRADKVSSRGMRNVVDGDLTLLKRFSFNQHAVLAQTFSAQIAATIDRATGAFSVQLPGYTKKMITSPEGASHYRFALVAAEIDFVSETFDLNEAMSEPRNIGVLQEPGLELSVSLAPGSTKSLLLAFGLTFFQEGNDGAYAMNNGAFNSLDVIEVNQS